jgi:hypothetical protein
MSEGNWRTTMKITAMIKTEIDAQYLQIKVPVKYGNEDIPADFPLRINDTWSALVEIDTGRILDWPCVTGGVLQMKICDEGSYRLLDGDFVLITSIENDYVPNNLIPGKYGDYIELNINESGNITNWAPKDLSDFFTS